jgi:carbonic anhydrase
LRPLLRLAAAALSFGAVALGSCGDTGPLRAAHAADPVERLLEGNRRFVQARQRHPDATPRRRREVAGGQHPFAVVLACADSRVAPELLFDTGLGDLFTVRVAGNLLNDENVASIEYAVEHLHVPLVVVLGHERCGAVAAALEKKELPGHLGSLARGLAPAVAAAEGRQGDRLDLAVRANVEHVVQALRASHPILAEHAAKGALRIVGARYDLDTGEVELVPR